MNPNSSSFKENHKQKSKKYFNIGFAKANLQDFSGAITDFNKAIEINPQDEEAYSIRGLVKAYLKDYNGAIEDFTKAIKINPQNECAYYNRGVAKCKLQDYSGAIKDYTIAININPQNSVPSKSELPRYSYIFKKLNKVNEINSKVILDIKIRKKKYSDN